MHVLLNQMNPQTLQQCLGSEFSLGSPCIFSVTDIQAKSVECSTTKPSLYMLTLHHQCNGHISLI